MNAETNLREETMNLTPMMTPPPTSDPKRSSSAVRKEGRVSREEQEREEQRNRVRRFLKETHRDKLYFPLDDVPGRGISVDSGRVSGRDRLVPHFPHDQEGLDAGTF